MPYIAFELDAMARAENVARARSLPDTVVKGGLLNLWAHCFRETTDDVTRVQVQAFFGHDVAADLEAFGFLEVRGLAYRVRGAERYLRLKKAYAKGAAKTNALRRRPKASDSVAIASPGVRSETPSHRAASSEHRTATTEEKTSSAQEPREPKVPDTRHAPLVAELCATFERKRGGKYPFTDRDAAEVTKLLALGPETTIIQGWSRALDARFPTISTLAKYRAEFARFVGAGEPTEAVKGHANASAWTEADYAKENFFDP